MEASILVSAPAAEHKSNESNSVQIECRPHWGALIVPVFSLLAWLASGVALAWLVRDFLGLLQPDYGVAGPRLILTVYFGSTAILLWLCWKSHRQSRIKLINRKAVFTSGLLPLFNSSTEVDLGLARKVALRESLLGRLFNFGTVCILSPKGERMRIRFVPNPRQFYQRLRGHLDGLSPD